MTVSRAATPTQCPVGELYWEGTSSRVEESTLASSSLLGQQFQRRRVLGQEDVGGGGVALLLDLAGESLVLAVADLDLGAVLLFEALDQRFGHRFVLGAVEGQRAARVRRGASASGDGKAGD